MPTVSDKLWLWGHPAGSYTGIWNLGGNSAISVAAAAAYMGLRNVILVAFGGKPEPPLLPHAQELKHLDKLVWSIVGDSSSKRNDQQTDLDEVVALVPDIPPLAGAIMDDFFHKPNESGAVSRYSGEEIAGFADALHRANRPLDLWVVLYAHDLDLDVAPILAECDVVTFWTWTAPELADLERNMARVRELAPGKRIVQGCYMWDFGTNQEIPQPALERQFETGLEWLKAGVTDGMILLASCICDLGIPGVEWARQWVARVGSQPLP
ncbi:MAG: hypothetical protein GXY52_02305 [Chloroflexi bacterium]|nr:hypothetical protein [Chloroflexota bacterium]